MSISYSNLINRKEIKEEIRQIEESRNDFITPTGIIYVDYGNDLFFKRKNHINQHNGYLYTSINGKDGKKHTRRVHVLVAKAYLDNPNNYTIVGHKDNNKANPNLKNLYWTTTSENTKKAYNDGLAKNDKGYEDSQAIPIYVFNMDKELIMDFGSACLCSKELKVSKSTIARQCKHEVKKSRCGYYFRYQKEYDEKGFVL